ncbi:hypothetical protein BC834DRAFT_875541 [Gloeopeniophorella convolvens]|nr:hypothetical protein BC834DRAFT_875541 [Gloeopeniophorella convolvens]
MRVRKLVVRLPKLESVIADRPRDAAVRCVPGRARAPLPLVTRPRPAARAEHVPGHATPPAARPPRPTRSRTAAFLVYYHVVVLSTASLATASASCTRAYPSLFTVRGRERLDERALRRAPRVQGSRCAAQRECRIAQRDHGGNYEEPRAAWRVCGEEARHRREIPARGVSGRAALWRPAGACTCTTSGSITSFPCTFLRCWLARWMASSLLWLSRRASTWSMGLSGGATGPSSGQG